MEACEPDEILGMPEAQYLRDAYVAGLFGRIWDDHSKCEIQLIDADFPDAQLRDTDHELMLEITIADRKGRRMVLEHRQRRERGESTVLPIDREQDREHAIEAIPRAIGQKVEKYFGNRISNRRVAADLLLYVNFSTLLGPLLSNNEMVELTRPFAANFNAIWLLLGARIFRPWPTQLTYSALNDPFR